MSNRLSLDTKKLREQKRKEVQDWLDTIPYEDRINLIQTRKIIYEEKIAQEKLLSDTKRVNIVYNNEGKDEAETVFIQIKNSLLIPFLKNEAYPMMRTQMHLFYIVRDELIVRHPELIAKKESLVQSWFRKLGEKQTKSRYNKFKDKQTKKMEVAQTAHKPMEKDSSTIYKNLDLHSPAHKLICEELERNQVMFMYEVNTVLPGDNKTYRRIDLIVIQNNRAVIVEIDGKEHRSTQKQYQDDTNRDRLVGNHWSNQLRLEYGEIMDDFRENEGKYVMRKILSRCDPNAGVIR
jgi:very-short-patch-repair endonuclease